MKVRATAIVLALCCAASAVHAAPSRRAPAETLYSAYAAQTAVPIDTRARMADWRQSRWSLGGAEPRYEEEQPSGVKIRWRLNRVKLRAPIDFNIN